MSKTFTVSSDDELAQRKADITASAAHTRKNLLLLLAEGDPLVQLRAMKFDRTGCDPLKLKRSLNLIEQLNQTFTYWATFEAAGYLLKKHPEAGRLTLNLGTRAGWDIETTDGKQIAAEVFAAVTPQNNRKLRKDVAKVAKSKAEHKYVFFSCPGYEFGIQEPDPRHPDVTIVSVGMYGDAAIAGE